MEKPIEKDVSRKHFDLIRMRNVEELLVGMGRRRWEGKGERREGKERVGEREKGKRAKLM